MSGYKLVWSDEFDYEGLPDPKKWNYNAGGHGWGNNEDQFYVAERPKNCYVKDGKLKITAQKEKYENRNYTSGKLTTYNIASWKYGRFEIKAKLPKGLGTWPAIWMLPNSIHTGENWPLCGEIDIMEHVGKNENMVHFSLHSELYNHVKNTQVTYFKQFKDVCSMFHEYAIEWTEEYIEVFVDKITTVKWYKGENNHITSNEGWPFDKEFYLILNLAIGGNWGGKIDESIFPCSMEVEYVRVYQKI